LSCSVLSLRRSCPFPIELKDPLQVLRPVRRQGDGIIGSSQANTQSLAVPLCRLHSTRLRVYESSVGNVFRKPPCSKWTGIFLLPCFVSCFLESSGGHDSLGACRCSLLVELPPDFGNCANCSRPDTSWENRKWVG
jgi:hypothetical protein